MVLFDLLEGCISVDVDNNYCVFILCIGICCSDGQFDIVWEVLEFVKLDFYFFIFGFFGFWLR